jgi:hexosaminidase
MKFKANRRRSACFMIAVTLPCCSPAVSAAEGTEPLKVAASGNAGIDVIPRPAKIEVGEGRFTLTAQSAILVSKDTQQTGQYLAGILAKATGYPLKVALATSETGRAGTLELSLSRDAGQLGDEGYELQVLADRVRIKAAKPAGVFYGCQTLRQLLPTEIESRTQVEGTAWSAPVVKIEDKPQFVWRGLMLDPARQFISKHGILKYIDLLAYHKLNRLHLHLTDSDGWRLEIRKYPRLTEVAAWANYGDGVEVGGFYAQEDVKEIVAYAAERFVVIVPEIETPSHAGAAMVAYPELNCFGTRKSIARFPIDPLCGSEYCPGNDKVFEFLEGVFTEVARLFPGPYVHVGGDEAEMRYWGECPKCRERQRKVGNLHAWFMGRVKNMVESKGRRVIGWGGVAPGAVFTCWDNDGSGGWSAAKSGWDVIMSTGNNLYINYNIDRTTLKTTYDFDPAPASAGLSAEARRHVLGVEACLWGEMVPENHLDSQAFPRLLALAERGWGIDRYDFADFLARVEVHVHRLAGMGVLTGPAFGYPIVPTIPARIRNALPSLIYSASQNQNDEDWRWALTGIDRGQGYDALHPLHAFDGDLETFHLAWGPRKDVDTFTIVLKEPSTFDHVKAVTGMANGDHILRQGVLEVSRGYGRWSEVARFDNGVAEANLDDAKPVVAVRLRSTINQSPFDLLAVREIILEKDGKSTLKEILPVERLRLPAANANGM